MKRFLLMLLSAALLVTFAGCGGGESVPLAKAGEHIGWPGGESGSALSTTVPAEGTEPEGTAPAEGTFAVAVTIGEKVFSATLTNNETTRALRSQFPLALNMSELNGNEKYYYLQSELPTAQEKPGQIQAGDLMLFEEDCLVLFYESFSSSHSYTRLGSIDEPAGLAEILGMGSMTVTFEEL